MVVQGDQLHVTTAQLQTVVHFEGNCLDALISGLVVLFGTLTYQVFTGGSTSATACASNGGIFGSAFSLPKPLCKAMNWVGGSWDAIVALFWLVGIIFIIVRVGILKGYHDAAFSRLFIGFGMCCGWLCSFSVTRLGGNSLVLRFLWFFWVCCHWILTESSPGKKFHFLNFDGGFRIVKTTPGSMTVQISEWFWLLVVVILPFTMGLAPFYFA